MRSSVHTREVVLIRDIIVRYLAVAVCSALVTTGVLLILPPLLNPPIVEETYDYTWERAFTQSVAIAEVNGTLHSFYDDDIDDIGEGLHNMTLPTFYLSRTIELNDSVWGVRIECMFHQEFGGYSGDMINMTLGAYMVAELGNLTFTASLPRSYWLVSEGLGLANTWTSSISVNGSILQALNVSQLYFEYEYTFGTQCASYYWVNWAMSLVVDIQYRTPA